MTRIGKEFLFAIAWLALASGCTRLPETRVTPLKSETLNELQGYLLTHKSELDQFRLRGPFTVTMQKNITLRLSAAERFRMDLFLSSSGEKAPLVIFLHGHDSSKEAHAYQAMHLASWGMHSLAVQLPKTGPWVGNGKTLAKIVNYIHRRPEFIDRRIDASKIILVGHSFGGYAVAVALAEGAPAAGGILLDPAALGRDIPRYLQQIKIPIMVLGADEDASPARNRDYFYRYIRSGIAEVSIRNAAHEDAQYPSEFALRNFGFDPHATEELQLTFVSALTSAAFSLASSRSFDYAWKSYSGDLANGKLFNARKK